MNTTKPQVKPSHPRLAELIATTEAYEAARRRYTELSKNASSLFAFVTKGTWTAQIEAAVGKADELEAIRVEFDEHILTLQSYFGIASQAGYTYSDLQRKLYDLIADAINWYDTMPAYGPDWQYRAFIGTAIIDAINACEVRPENVYCESAYDRNIGRAHYRIAAQVYLAFASDLIARDPKTKDIATGPVIQGRKYKSILNPDVDFRRLCHVPFRADRDLGCSGLYPKAELLSSLIEAAQAARAELDACVKELKTQNGVVNERQHAARMIDVLHGAQVFGTDNDPKAAIQAQQGRRSKYEASRQAVLIAYNALKDIQEKVLDALKECVKEAEPLIALTMQDKEIVTVDKWRDAPIIMTNNLFADQLLRKVQGELTEAMNTFSKDLTEGVGWASIEAQLKSLTPRYRRAPVTSSGGGGDVEG